MKDVKQISITNLVPFAGHPYKVEDNEDMEVLTESIRENGILNPLIVRPAENDPCRFEIVSGHRRAHAARLAGIETVPAFVYPLNRDQAAVLVVDSNLHRERLLPSEKAFAYKLKMEALKRQGRRTDLTSSQVATKLDTAAQIGAASNESRDQVFRYIRLTNLRPELLNMMDEGKIAFSVGVELSYLPDEAQDDLLDAMAQNDCTPSYAQAVRLHKAYNVGALDRWMIEKTLAEPKPNQREHIRLKRETFDRFFPDHYTAADIEQDILKGLELLKRQRDRSRDNLGEPLSQPPYGYIKSPEDKKRWIIEPEAAAVVRQIFRLCIEGKGNESIARILTEQKILNPTAYWRERGEGRGGKKTQPNPYLWKHTTVEKILRQQEYCGDVINFKTYSKSFKNKQRFENPEENWVVFKGKHEAIIDRDTFEQVQQKIKKTKRRAPKAENGPKHLLTDYLYCADCHSKLWHHTNTRNKDIHYFSCSNYSGDYGGTCTSRHYIRADAIEQVVLLELRRLASFLRYDEEAFADILTQKTNRDMLAEQKRLERELQKAIARNETVVRMYEKLYEDNASGKVTDEWFMQLSHKYEVERMELKNKIADCRQQLSELGSMQQGRDSFLQAIRRFMEMGTLTAPLLQELIDHIDVYETEGKGKHRTQRVVIYYRFVGYIDLSDAAFAEELLAQENHKADTRQGVAVEYLPEKPKPEHRPAEEASA